MPVSSEINLFNLVAAMFDYPGLQLGFTNQLNQVLYSINLTTDYIKLCVQLSSPHILRRIKARTNALNTLISSHANLLRMDQLNYESLRLCLWIFPFLLLLFFLVTRSYHY